MPKETASQWREIDIGFDGPDVANPYTDINAWVTFTHSGGQQLRRPVFWDGGTDYRVRFASTQSEGEWQWRVFSDRPVHTFRPACGTVFAGPPAQDHPHRALTRGFTTAHRSGRSFCYADGSPAFWVFDTAWAMPFRATVSDVEAYAADRQAKGFNADGAASLWQWRLHPEEPGHGAYFLAEGAGWRQALDFDGSRFISLVGKIMDVLPITEASPCWDVSSNSRGLLDPGVFYLGYAEHGGPWVFFDGEGRVPSKYWLIDPRTGQVLKSGNRPPNYVPIEFDRYKPSLLICAETTPAWVQQAL